MPKKFDAYQLPGQRGRMYFRAQLPLVNDKSKKTWIHAAMCGEWKGHHAGEFEITPKVIESFVKNFNAQSNAIPLFYEHEQGKAAGWIHELKRDGHDLMAFVEFTDEAAELVQSGAYKFCSIGADFEATDRASGEPIGPELFEISLTNVPFIDGLKAIQLSRRVHLADGENMSDTDMIKAALSDLGDEASLEQVMSLVEAEKAKQAVLEGEPAEEAPPEEEEAEEAEASKEDADVVTAAHELQSEEEAMMAFAAVESIGALAGMDPAQTVAALQEQSEKIAEILVGQPEDGTAADDEAEEALAAVTASRNAALQVKLNKAQNRATELEAKLEAVENEKLEAVVDSAIDAGHFSRDLRSQLLSVIKHKRSDFDAFLNQAKEDGPPTGRAYRKAPTEKAELSALTPEQTYKLNVMRNAGVSEERALARVREPSNKN